MLTILSGAFPSTTTLSCAQAGHAQAAIQHISNSLFIPAFPQRFNCLAARDGGSCNTPAMFLSVILMSIIPVDAKSHVLRAR
ncbi:hypothetical protein [Bradyrhizobium sp.]|uniref:hypothetical protein n=1 Tax=Bradyrhizobium sp. TaxID=376 RepID=UPI003C2A8D50